MEIKAEIKSDPRSVGDFLWRLFRMWVCFPVAGFNHISGLKTARLQLCSHKCLSWRLWPFLCRSDDTVNPESYISRCNWLSDSDGRSVGVHGVTWFLSSLFMTQTNECLETLFLNNAHLEHHRHHRERSSTMNLISTCTKTTVSHISLLSHEVRDCDEL